MGRKRIWPPPIYKSKNGMERMRVYRDGKPVDIILGPAGSEEAKAEYKRQLLLLESQSGTPAKKGEATVRDVTAGFIETAEKERGEDWDRLARYRAAFKPLLAIMQHRPATSLDAEALLLIQKAMASGSWMTEEEKQESIKQQWPIGWARTVVNARVAIIKATWRWAETQKMVPAGTYAHLLTVKGVPATAKWCRSTPKRGSTSRADLDKVLPFCTPPIAAMLELQWYAGMRSGEVRVMRLGDIDRSGKVWSYLPSVDKNAWRGGETAPVALGPECQRILAPWIAAAPADDAYLFRPLLHRRGSKDGEILIAGPEVCYSEWSYPQAVRRACAKAGVKIIAYGCRHATKERITRAAGADAARAVLRQRNIQSTTHYGNIDTEHAREVMERLG